ncbi:hypothetical protein [Amycolatopsis japonica]
MTDGTGGPPGNFSDILGDFSAQADRMMTAAKEGQFKVSAEAGKAYQTALDDYLDAWATNGSSFGHLAMMPQLGSGPYANEIGKHAVLVADGDDKSARTQLEALKEVVNKAKEAIAIAMQHYDSRESEAIDSIKAAGKN